MRRILFLHQTSQIGGGSYCLLNILKSLDRTTLLPIVCLKNEGDLVNEISKLGVTILFFNEMSDLPYNQPLYNYHTLIKYFRVYNSISKFSKLLQEYEIDIVYLNNMMLCDYLRPAKMLGLKTIVHVREHWPLHEHIHQLNRVRKLVSDYADQIIAINNYSASIFQTCNIPISIVHDWVDMDSRYQSISLDNLLGEKSTHLKVLLFTGGFSRIKGVLSVVKAFTSTLSDDNYRLLIVGASKVSYNEGVKGKIKTFLSKLHLYHYYIKDLLDTIEKDKRIICVPPIYEITDIMAKSYCFVSNFTIPHANLALAESLIIGIPCLAADTEESREYSCNGKFALLSKFGDDTDFCNKLKEIVDNNDVYKDLALSGKNIVKEMFSPDKNIELLNKILQTL